MLDTLRDTWRKNAPEVISAVTHGLPDFVMSPSPGKLRGIPVFCYHEIAGAEFESHLQFLKENHYQTLTADDFMTLVRREQDPNANSDTGDRRIVITFDDGLLSLYTTVFPLLREYDVRVVAFIAPAFHAARPNHTTCSGQLPVCSWQQIDKLHASGLVDFQSHTLEHRIVTQWPLGSPLTGMSDDVCNQFRGPALALADDFARSREELERYLGKRVRHLAFPQYDGTAEAIHVGRNCGYEAFYWGVKPWKPINKPGDDLSRVVRLSGEFLPRLPGRGRKALRAILRERYRKHAGRWFRRFAAGNRIQ